MSMVQEVIDLLSPVPFFIQLIIKPVKNESGFYNQTKISIFFLTHWSYFSFFAWPCWAIYSDILNSSMLSISLLLSVLYVL